MNTLKMLKGSATGNQTLYQIINGLGLTTNLKVCLDAGDNASYNSSVQTDKWLDTSGTGEDFFRGTGTGSDAADPTFNGTAGGLSSGEYWSFDGGDYFTYDTTNPAWMNTLHKDGAKVTVLCVFYSVSHATVYRLFATRKTSGAGSQGIVFAKNVTSGTFLVNSFNATTASATSSTAVFNNSAWNVGGVSVDENGTNRVLFNVNGTAETNTTYSYTSPSTSDTTSPARIGAFTDGNTPIPSGGRIACLAIWDTNLTATNLADLYNGIKGRFGL